MSKKLKKLLKTVGKVGGAIMLGKALMGGRKKSDGFLSSGAAGGARLPKGDRNAMAIKAMTSNDAYNDDTMPGMLSRNMGMKPKRRNMYSPNDFGLGPYDGAKDGGRIGKKSGGKVKGCGIAKRGLGRAMKKGNR